MTAERIVKAGPTIPVPTSWLDDITAGDSWADWDACAGADCGAWTDHVHWQHDDDCTDHQGPLDHHASGLGCGCDPWPACESCCRHCAEEA